MEDREIDLWHEQWSGVAAPLPDVQEIRRKIKRQQRRFVLDNLLAAIGLLAGLAFALVVRQRQNMLGRGWAAGICALMFLAAGIRLWSQRGTWHAEAQSTRSFAELWRRRVAARIRTLRVAIYLSCGWLAACALLAAANWSTVGPQFRAHPAQWLAPIGISAVATPFLFLWAAWLRRRKLVELREVENILRELEDAGRE